jgi:hypothetical protein
LRRRRPEHLATGDLEFGSVPIPVYLPVAWARAYTMAWCRLNSFLSLVLLHFGGEEDQLFAWPGGIIEVPIRTRHQQNSKQWNAGRGTSTDRRDGVAMNIQTQCPVCIKHGPEYRGLPCPTCNTVGDGPWTLVEGRLYHVRYVNERNEEV